MIKEIINIHPVIKTFNGSYKVIDSISMGPIIKDHGQYILIKTNEHIEIGTTLFVKGKSQGIIANSDFDIKGYLSTHWISSIIYHSKLKKISYDNNFIHNARRYLTTGPSWFKKMAPLFLLSMKTQENKGILMLAKKLSVIHLLIISGFHITLLYKILNRVFKKMGVIFSNCTPIILIFFYLYFLNWSIPSLRAYLFLVFYVIFKKVFKFSCSSFDLIALAGICILLLNPYNINSVSFELTLFASITIMYINQFKFKYGITKYISIVVGVYLMTLPITIKINGFISIFGPLYSIALTPLVSLLYILSWILLPFKEWLNTLYKLTYLVLIFFVETCILIKDVNITLFIQITYNLFFVLFLVLFEMNTQFLYAKRNLLKQQKK
ncbi:ComEC/Rec2 family competence protein [Mycoplasma marinum]|uniref:ComEC/Rec2 family competence protein n=1 Tax=Mycoplasma marinum TaxID=1937190 RepID=UPI0014441194|nr:ComEC/Rec2 family competence protein [Mycoplasma marinum]